MKQSLNWRLLEHRRFDARLLMFYKIHHNLVAINMPEYIQQPSRISRHMHPLSFRQVQVRVDFQKWSFFPHTVILWNNLPAEIALAPTLAQFKASLAKHTY